MYGVEWIEEYVKYIIEDEQNYYQVLTMLAPIHRTPFSREDGSALKRYIQKVQRSLAQMTPWKGKGVGIVDRAAFERAGAKPGEIAVFLDAGDSPNSKLYKDAKVSRSR